MTNSDLLKELKKNIGKSFGQRCPEFNWFCAPCSAWLAYSILEELLDESDWEKPEIVKPLDWLKRRMK